MNQVFMRTRVNTTRRPGAEASIDLRQRRRWFTDPPPATPPAGDPPPAPKPDDIPDWMRDPAKVQEEIKKLRGEAAEHRSKRGEAEKALAKIDAERKTADDAKLLEQSEFKKLYEQEKAAREKAEALAQTATLAALRLKIATEAGLPAGLAARLQGASEEELKADAEALKALIPQTPAPAAAPGGQPQRPNTTPVPGGGAAQETDAQRRERLRGGGPNGVLSGGIVQVVKRPE